MSFISKVAVLSAGGGIGQLLSLLLKASPLVSHLAPYDVANTAGVAADLSHINTKARVSAHQEAEQLADCVKGPAGVPRNPGLARDDLFNTSASIVRHLSKVCAGVAPKAMLAIISNPVHSTVPIASEVAQKPGKVAGLHEPEYLKSLKPNIGFYDLLDLDIRGYDFVSLEKYQSFLHKQMFKMGFNVTKTWSSPHRDLVIETLKDRSFAQDETYTLKMYERNIQIKEATVRKLPILIEVINSTIPPGVSFDLHRHGKDDETRLYFRDLVLEKLKTDLQDLKDTPLIGVSV